MNSYTAIFGGGLSGSNKFFGGSTAEIVARNVDYAAIWNGDMARSVYSTRSWFIRGGRSTDGTGAGGLAFHDVYAAAYISEWLSHRTILSGY